MKRTVPLLAAGLAAIVIGCTAEQPAPVANVDNAPTMETGSSTPEIKLVSLNVPNMT